LDALYPKGRTSRPCREQAVYPYRLKDLTIERPNQVWATDICYLPMAQENLVFDRHYGLV